MKSNDTQMSAKQQIILALRIALVTLFFCSGIYSLIILSIGQTLVPYTANGSLLRNKDGEVVGSEAIAQSFTKPEYFWPRPSASDYNAAASCGSNLSSTNPLLRTRTEKILKTFNADKGNLLPADLVTASGSGLDPLITLKSAQFQLARVAQARGIQISILKKFLENEAHLSGRFFYEEPLLNVLVLNLALDKLEISHE